ncbi:MAG: hypothetical protein MZU95_06890 [Desulfomicrobium escambiense]|nr:hypothetical protein [Desulfomicrobium escambiense]
MSSPLLIDTSIEGAHGVLINITGGKTMTLHEVSKASQLIHSLADPDANIIFGTVIDEAMKDTVKVTVIATGFDQPAGKARGRGRRRRPSRRPARPAPPGSRPRRSRSCPRRRPISSRARARAAGPEPGRRPVGAVVAQREAVGRLRDALVHPPDQALVREEDAP